MKKQNKKMLSLALGMSLMAATVAAMPVMESQAATNGLFQAHEVAAPQLIAEGEKQCGSKSCASKDKKCGSKEKKCASKDKHCGSKEGKSKHCGSKEKKCASKAKGADKKCGAGSCGSKTKGK